MENNLLKVNNLHTSFFTHFGEVKAVQNVSFSLKKGEVLGIVGESGSGKSVTALSCMRLLQAPGKVVKGEILFNGENILKKSKKEMREIRGNRISMIFQNPMTSLNPVSKIGNQIVEQIIEHKKISKREARKEAVSLMEKVQIPDAEKRINSYPHEFSGGMRQRAIIAMAISCEPDLIIADEPTTALDVTIQAQILALLRRLKDQLETSVILITHDLGVIAEICSRVIVMYGSMIMEEAPIDDIFFNPQHPYTMGLLESIPRVEAKRGHRLIPIKGTPPNQLNPGKGCPFAPRCKYAMKICTKRLPEYTWITKTHRSMCWLLHKNAPKNPYKRVKN